MSKITKKFKGIHWSKMPNAEDIRKQISATKKAMPTRYWLGKHLTKEHIEKMSNTKRKNSPRQFHEQLRASQRYNRWRKEIYERDCFKCVFCGNGGFLNADHIRPFSILVKEFLALFPNPDKLILYETAMNWLPLWDISNGRTLCIDCHRATDTYGKNTPKITHT